MGKLPYFALFLLIVTLLNPGILRAQATSTPATDPYNTIDVEREVRSSFANTPVMIRIAKCESEFRQFNDQTGAVLDGGAGEMIGVFQIYRPVHQATAKALGFDIDTLAGNLGYAKHLYEREGTNPWISSFPCWNDSNVEATSSLSTGGAITVNLSFGMSHPQILSLQQILNKGGFTVASEGPGSVGNETTMFGNLTRDAVRRFQCAKGITCSGDEYSSGYGFVGPRTRAALAALTPESIPAPSPTPTPVPATPVALTPPVSSSQSDAEKIAALLKIIAELEAQIAVLKANQAVQ